MKKIKLFGPIGQPRINSQYFSQHYRQLLLRVLLILCVVVAISATVINLADWVRDPISKWGSYNLIIDGITLVLLACLYRANQRGFTSLAGWLLGVIMIAGIPTSYSVSELNQTFLIMLLPVTFSSFIIRPWASFFFACLVIVFYHVTFFQHPGAFAYDAFSLATLSLMAVISYLIAIILNKAIGDTVRAYDETIQGWANALEMRDSETMGHSQRIVELTLILAKKVGVKDADLSHIRRGALLHDIGKMGIPDAILHKPGNLTDAEWKIMRKHPVYARSYLSAVSYLAPALDIPYSHHERWDGTGYPQGLKGEEIPLAARIFAIVDVWDALTSQRPYRGAWSPEKALAHIQEQAGKHFDPRVVDVFLELIENQRQQ
ncbi:MAG: HD-GYP domain-containing protein [Chloroflexota bacterium]|nr:HD-GYP domain-containing protein [Anaerolineales bacterium]